MVWCGIQGGDGGNDTASASARDDDGGIPSFSIGSTNTSHVTIHRDAGGIITRIEPNVGRRTRKTPGSSAPTSPGQPAFKQGGDGGNDTTSASAHVETANAPKPSKSIFAAGLHKDTWTCKTCRCNDIPNSEPFCLACEAVNPDAPLQLVAKKEAEKQQTADRKAAEKAKSAPKFKFGAKPGGPAPSFSSTPPTPTPGSVFGAKHGHEEHGFALLPGERVSVPEDQKLDAYLQAQRQITGASALEAVGAPAREDAPVPATTTPPGAAVQVSSVAPTVPHTLANPASKAAQGTSKIEEKDFNPSALWNNLQFPPPADVLHATTSTPAADIPDIQFAAPTNIRATTSASPPGNAASPVATRGANSTTSSGAQQPGTATQPVATCGANSTSPSGAQQPGKEAAVSSTSTPEIMSPESFTFVQPAAVCRASSTTSSSSAQPPVFQFAAPNRMLPATGTSTPTASTAGMQFLAPSAPSEIAEISEGSPCSFEFAQPTTVRNVKAPNQASRSDSQCSPRTDPTHQSSETTRAATCAIFAPATAVHSGNTGVYTPLLQIYTTGEARAFEFDAPNTHTGGSPGGFRFSLPTAVRVANVTSIPEMAEETGERFHFAPPTPFAATNKPSAAVVGNANSFQFDAPTPAPLPATHAPSDLVCGNSFQFEPPALTPLPATNTLSAAVVGNANSFQFDAPTPVPLASMNLPSAVVSGNSFQFDAPSNLSASIPAGFEFAPPTGMLPAHVNSLFGASGQVIQFTDPQKLYNHTSSPNAVGQVSAGFRFDAPTAASQPPTTTHSADGPVFLFDPPDASAPTTAASFQFEQPEFSVTTREDAKAAGGRAILSAPRKGLKPLLEFTRPTRSTTSPSNQRTVVLQLTADNPSGIDVCGPSGFSSDVRKGVFVTKVQRLCAPIFPISLPHVRLYEVVWIHLCVFHTCTVNY